MTRKLTTGVVLIEPEPDDICELCGKKDELRPYGPNGERICFACGMKNKETTKRKFGERLDDAGTMNPTSN